jgi:hypothetical protein
MAGAPVSGVAGDGGAVFYIALFIAALLVSIALALVTRSGYRAARRGWEHYHRPDPEAERAARIELCLTRLEDAGVNVPELLGEWLPARPRV